MAITTGDKVSMSLFSTLGTNGLVGPLVQAQPPHFGIADDGSGVDVLWDDGTFASGITATSLDVIGLPSAQNVTDFQGKFVQVLNESPEYQGTVVSLYTRDAAGAGSPSGTLALVFTNVGTYREVLISNLAVVAGR